MRGQNLSERKRLELYRRWLVDVVLPGFERQSDNTESVRRTKDQIADLDWQLETDPPRLAPTCGWRKAHKLHKENCTVCRQNAERLKRHALAGVSEDETS